MAEYKTYNIGPFVGAAVAVDRETAERVRGEDGFVPLEKYGKYVEPLKGEVGVFFWHKAFRKGR